MDFSSPEFRPLSRGAHVIDSQEHTLDPLHSFSLIAHGTPEAERLIMSEDGLDIVASPKPFFGISLSFILGKSEKEVRQNQVILEKFQEALIKRYGIRLTEFAFPDLNHRLLHGSQLDSRTINQVLQEAALFEEIFSVESPLHSEMDQAVKDDIDAMAACTAFEKTADEYERLYSEAQAASRKKEATTTAISTYIKTQIETLSLSPDDPKARELQTLQILWRNASLETPENPSESLELFEKAATESDRTKQDRFVLNREGTRLTASPRALQGWTGTIFQVVSGRDKKDLEENRRTIIGFRKALTKKYGHTITSFVFATSLSRHTLGSRLNSKTIQETLKKAEQVSAILNNPSLQELITTWKADIQASEASEIRYRTIKIERQESSQVKEATLARAEASYQRAEKHLLHYLTEHALEKSISLAQTARLLHLWFDEARARYKNTHLQNIPSPPLERDFETDPSPAVNPHYQEQSSDNTSSFAPTAPIDPYEIPIATEVTVVPNRTASEKQDPFLR